MISWVALGLLLPVAIVMLLQWRQVLLGLDGSARMERLVTTIWAPLIASLGLLGLLWDQTEPLHGPSALAIGSGSMVFAVLVGSLLLRSDSVLQDQEQSQSNWQIPISWPVAGVLMLMVGAAGRVSHIVGLVVFAIGLVLIWLNSLPADSEASSEKTKAMDGHLITALLAAVVLATCARLSPVDWLIPIGIVLTVAALIVFVLMARICGELAAIKAGGWCAVLLPCFGFGLLGQNMLSAIIDSDQRAAPPRFEYTSSLLEPGLVLLATVLVLGGVHRWSGNWRAPASLALMVAGILGFGILLTRAAG